MANKSEELRKVITRLLKLSCTRTYYSEAKDNAKYPYQVFIFDSQTREQYPREDDIIIIDIWDKSNSWTEVERLADEIEANMNMKNEPNSFVLPTFFMIDRKNLKDPDKNLKHVLLKFLIQNYYIGV
ncbi:hypothetical protein I5677_12105 [Mobilitalea sibirica]|uniref:Uncharacterized protein n=1 Tax=Mobilitalea sibirica TaxID=1462919 RepID=A0A8J7HBZ5_9FIRM|nr:hypothetical protein [Mobilitalea sibirica]MBH1941636.1 hypothetical protein [Mobilitalea sibirica]